MKKLALIMLAVVSMALVSCGGGNSDVKLADPAVTYKHFNNLADCVDISVKINSFDVKASEDDKKIIVSAKIELTDTDGDIDVAYVTAQLLNENEEVVVDHSQILEFKKIGEVGLFSAKITPKKDLPASKTLNQVKYIRFVDVYGHKYPWD